MKTSVDQNAVLRPSLTPPPPHFTGNKRFQTQKLVDITHLVISMVTGRGTTRDNSRHPDDAVATVTPSLFVA